MQIYEVHGYGAITRGWQTIAHWYATHLGVACPQRPWDCPAVRYTYISTARRAQCQKGVQAARSRTATATVWHWAAVCTHLCAAVGDEKTYQLRVIRTFKWIYFTRSLFFRSLSRTDDTFFLLMAFSCTTNETVRNSRITNGDFSINFDDRSTTLTMEDHFRKKYI